VFHVAYGGRVGQAQAWPSSLNSVSYPGTSATHPYLVCVAALSWNKELPMNATYDLWMKLHAPYYIDSDTAFTPLLHDASNFLQGAHGIIRCLSDALKSPDIETVDTYDLSSALAGVAILIKMGHACVGKAHLRILMQQMGADESTH
jgi:hypothetical protein